MSSDAPNRPLRADARRNVEKLITQAAADFANYGADVSLDDIAKRAGVGSATLFRHFPSRDALLAEVIRASIDALHDESQQLATADDPDSALHGWLLLAISHAAQYRGLAASLMASYYDTGSPLHRSCSAMHIGGSKLLERAQQQGSVRPHVTGQDLFTMIAAIAWATEWPPEGADTTPSDLPSIMLAGLFRSSEPKQPPGSDAGTNQSPPSTTS